MKTKQLVEGPLGIRMPDALAKSLDGLLKTLPKECRTLHHKSSVPDNTEFVQGERADISLVSVESIDREGEVVVAKGCDLSYFQKNPIVTFAHKYDELPVGRAQWIKTVPGGIKAKTVYATRPDDWQGPWLPDAVWSMTRENILVGKSVGFIPTRIRPPSKDEAQWKNASAVIESSVLLEYAIAPVPVNQDALVEAVAKGFADEASLKKLGLPLPTKTRRKSTNRPKVDEVALLLKALEQLKINPNRVMAMIEDRMRNRGKV